MPVIRKILPTELPQYRAHLLRLDRADRYARFTGILSDEAVERHCAAINWGRTVILGAFEDGVIGNWIRANFPDPCIYEEAA